MKLNKAYSVFIDKDNIWPRVLSEAEQLLISEGTEIHSPLSIPNCKEIFFCIFTWIINERCALGFQSKPRLTENTLVATGNLKS